MITLPSQDDFAISIRICNNGTVVLPSCRSELSDQGEEGAKTLGDAADYADVERFLRSPEGIAHLAQLEHRLRGRNVLDVTFTNEGDVVGMLLHLDSGDPLAVTLPSLDVLALRERFEEVLEREYRRDYPHRQP
jgi:hypothetical protein